MAPVVSSGEFCQGIARLQPVGEPPPKRSYRGNALSFRRICGIHWQSLKPSQLSVWCCLGPWAWWGRLKQRHSERDLQDNPFQDSVLRDKPNGLIHLKLVMVTFPIEVVSSPLFSGLEPTPAAVHKGPWTSWRRATESTKNCWCGSCNERRQAAAEYGPPRCTEQSTLRVLWLLQFRNTYGSRCSWTAPTRWAYFNRQSKC